MTVKITRIQRHGPCHIYEYVCVLGGVWGWGVICLWIGMSVTGLVAQATSWHRGTHVPPRTTSGIDRKLKAQREIWQQAENPSKAFHNRFPICRELEFIFYI